MDNNNLPANCNQCPNGCPAESLRCGKGRAYFERLKNGEAAPAPLPESENELVRLLTKCGKIAEHKSGKMREHGKDESAMFQSLSEDEQAQLTALLTKLQTTWKEEHAKHHGPHGHHGEHKHE